MEKKEKVLIIKPGYSEFLDYDLNSRKVSLGDVLRTTPLLHLYKKDHVTWVTDTTAFPLLKKNPYIDRLLPFDWIIAEQLKLEEFDIIINLEKVSGICALFDQIRTRRSRYGFRFDSQTGKAKAYDRAFEVLAVSSDSDAKQKNKRTVQELLFEMVGGKWGGEEYILGYKPATEKRYDLGLNTQVGEKWPTKSWPTKNWDTLAKKLRKDGFKVSQQEDKRHPKIMENLYDYMDWINSCDTLISNDSLGVHLGIALRKNVFGLFGPTPSKEVYFYSRGKAILPEPVPKCLPCFANKCKRRKNCMEDISVERVYEEIKNMCETSKRNLKDY